jgi:hypothetical protein
LTAAVAYYEMIPQFCILFQVVDMGIVVDVISQLENYAITKEALEVQNFLHLASYLS